MVILRPFLRVMTEAMGAMTMPARNRLRGGEGRWGAGVNWMRGRSHGQGAEALAEGTLHVVLAGCPQIQPRPAPLRLP